jgi:lipopolysaccharide transport system ATP-binding protein
MSAIRAHAVGKLYRRYATERPSTLKEAVLRGFHGMRGERFWALHEVSFEVEAGRTVGVIGGNGAGKSTLLRLIGGVERPDEGSIEVRGRIGALLELGASFHAELTGRENLMLAGVVAGLSRRAVRARFDDIVGFAQLEDFIDSPLRTYSTGMVTRLAFSIASHIEPEVLVVDEALAVGDLSFQQRCIDRIHEFRRAGVTIVIVSHDPNRIRDLCDEVIWLRGGRVAAVGAPTEVTGRYARSQAEETRKVTPHDVPVTYTPSGIPLRVHLNRFGSQEATISAVHVRDAWGEACSTIQAGSALTVDVEASIPDSIGAAIVGITIRRSDDVVCIDAYAPVEGMPRARARLQIERLDLAAGEYAVDVGLFSFDWNRTYDYHYGPYPLTVTGPSSGSGMMAPPLSWHVEKAEVRS